MLEKSPQKPVWDTIMGLSPDDSKNPMGSLKNQQRLSIPQMGTARSWWGQVTTCATYELSKKVIELTHNRYGSNHFGQRTSKRVQDSVYWPKWSDDLDKYIKCERLVQDTFEASWSDKDPCKRYWQALFWRGNVSTSLAIPHQQTRLWLYITSCKHFLQVHLRDTDKKPKSQAGGSNALQESVSFVWHTLTDPHRSGEEIRKAPDAWALRDVTNQSNQNDGLQAQFELSGWCDSTERSLG